jgi:hypothetical protein
MVEEREERSLPAQARRRYRPVQPKCKREWLYIGAHFFLSRMAPKFVETALVGMYGLIYIGHD